jgi:hypothetical protein
MTEISKADFAVYGAWVLGAVSTIGMVWNRFGMARLVRGLQSLHAQWDGFKLDFDRLNRSDARKEGELARIDQTQERTKL